uniref:Putative secreted protein n=1 Tax=Ixodes ricinus TaxID=34613 RepID=V5H7H3_IXORI
MKASIAAICFLVALSCVIAKLTEDECRFPLAFSSCEANSVRTIHSFFNNTNRCESYSGCGKGKNIFNTHEDCVAGCPYGDHSPSGRK